MQRRHLLAHGLATVALPLASGRAVGADASSPLGRFAAPTPLAPIQARPDRIIDISVCTRPFRAQGPRLEVERRFGRHIVHHYGHGGAGWSLSWGSARQALPLIRAGGEQRIGVIGCGAIGLTTARVAQRAGLKVRIYARERPPEVRSSAATGVWSPDSRLCTSEHATPAFAARWEQMARESFRTFQAMLGLPGQPVAWHAGYLLSDVPFDQPVPPAGGEALEPPYPHLEAALADLRPRSRVLSQAEHPFPVPYARRYTQLVFHLASYQRLLMEDFLREGGEFVTEEFVHPRELGRLRERTLVHATGYGARALWGDESVIPVRGQTARLVPQPEVDYGLYWRGHNVSVVPRHDGLLVQAQGEHDFFDAGTVPDRAASEAAVARLAALFPAG